MLAISAENVSKIYRLGEINRGQLFQDFRRWVRNRTWAPDDSAQPSKDVFWALKDVSFQIKEGETVGIVGANGAGKSTLLKVISRITSPSKGTIRIRGRIGSLLEVGTGFNPELTGRDNVYLNGAILGMSRTEIASKFDDIVSFSGVEKFIDTPVKRYSSGMFVRLAFAVAAFLEPEILIIDEVLSVGDQQFQNRCTERIQSLINDGRTILFVSHAAPLVERICKRAICLQKGSVMFDGNASEVLKKYAEASRTEITSQGNLQCSRIWDDDCEAPGDAIVRLLSIKVTNQHGHCVDQISCAEVVSVEIGFRILGEFSNIVPTLHVYDQSDTQLFVAVCTDPKRASVLSGTGCYRAIASIPANLLAPGVIRVGVVLNTFVPPQVHCSEQHSIKLKISDDFSDESARGSYRGVMGGVLRPKLKWITEGL